MGSAVAAPVEGPEQGHNKNCDYRSNHAGVSSRRSGSRTGKFSRHHTPVFLGTNQYWPP